MKESKTKYEKYLKTIKKKIMKTFWKKKFNPIPKNSI